MTLTKAWIDKWSANMYHYDLYSRYWCFSFFSLESNDPEIPSWQGQFNTNFNNMWPFNVYQQPMSDYYDQPDYDYYLPYEYDGQHHSSRLAMRNELLYY